MKRSTAKDSTVPAIDTRLLNRIRNESTLLRPRVDMMNFPINRNSLPDLQAERVKLVGESDGRYYMGDRLSGDRSNYHMAKIPDLKNRLKADEDQFKKYQVDEVNYGNNKPTMRASNRQEDYDILRARYKVAMEELAMLDGHIEALQKVEEEKVDDILPRKEWSTVKTDEFGIMISIGGMKVGRQDPEDPNSILIINDERSLFNGLLVARFKVEVLSAMAREYSYRKREELKNSEKENRKAKIVARPKTPIYHPGTRSFEYPGYSDVVLKWVKNLK